MFVCFGSHELPLLQSRCAVRRVLLFFPFRKYSLNLSAAAPHPITGSEWVRHFCWEPGDKFGLCCCFLSHGFSATHSVTLLGAVLLWALHHCCRTANAPPSSPSPATPVHFNSIFPVFLVASVPRELRCWRALDGLLWWYFFRGQYPSVTEKKQS